MIEDTEEYKHIYVDDKLVAIIKSTNTQELVKPRKLFLDIYYSNITVENPHEGEHIIYYSNHKDYDPDNHTVKELLTEEDKNIIDAINRLNTEQDIYLYYPVYAYIHSQIYLSLDKPIDRWDSGLFAIAQLDKKVFTDIDKIKQADIDDMNAYLNGNVIGFTVKDELNNFVDGCGGFLFTAKKDVIRQMKYVCEYTFPDEDWEYAINNITY